MSRTLTMLYCLILCIFTLTACTTQKKVNINSNQIVPKMKSANREIAINKSKEIPHKVNEAPHLQQVQNHSQQLPDAIVYKGNSRQKQVALTFDDGPDNYYTPRILDILRAKGVKATFFIVGKEAKRYPDMARRIVREGNIIGNHSWDHPKLWTLSNAQITQEIVSTDNELQSITGQRSKLFRPPYGKLTPTEEVLIHSLGYRIIDWSVDTLDWKSTPSSGILQIVNKEVTPGGIILEHCLAGHPGELNGTLQALPQIIDQLRAKGYEFVTVPALLSQ